MGQSSYKPRHRRGTNNHRTFNGRRDIKNMYDYSWRKYCDRFLAVNKDCYACGKLATVVDHLTPHKGDDFLFMKLDNHIPLCVSCHNTVTILFDVKYRPGSPITEKVQWLNRNRVPGVEWVKRVKVLSNYGG